jgi:hypothetical protein
MCRVCGTIINPNRGYLFWQLFIISGMERPYSKSIQVNKKLARRVIEFNII